MLEARSAQHVSVGTAEVPGAWLVTVTIAKEVYGIRPTFKPQDGQILPPMIAADAVGAYTNAPKPFLYLSCNV